MNVRRGRHPVLRWCFYRIPASAPRRKIPRITLYGWDGLEPRRVATVTTHPSNGSSAHGADQACARPKYVGTVCARQLSRPRVASRITRRSSFQPVIKMACGLASGAPEREGESIRSKNADGTSRPHRTCVNALYSSAVPSRPALAKAHPTASSILPSVPCPPFDRVSGHGMDAAPARSSICMPFIQALSSVGYYRSRFWTGMRIVHEIRPGTIRSSPAAAAGPEGVDLAPGGPIRGVGGEILGTLLRRLPETRLAGFAGKRRGPECGRQVWSCRINTWLAGQTPAGGALGCKLSRGVRQK